MENFDIERFVAIQNGCDKIEIETRKRSVGNPNYLIPLFVSQNENNGISNYDKALQEVKSGKKSSHWIWYIFPQLKGIGNSNMSNVYGIASLQEAEEYYENETLFKRLCEITNVLLNQNDNAESIFGTLDAMKVCSCMTLFNLVSPNDIFEDVLRKFYFHKHCQKTLLLLKNEMDNREKELTDNQNDLSNRIFRGIARPAFTPNALSVLKDDEIFVFGSNLQGKHYSGAARVARKKFGAVLGQGIGFQGQSYAIPTMQGAIETIKPYVDNFIIFAKQNPELYFYVTRIGCGIAGFKDEEIAPLFGKAIFLNNVVLPYSFKIWL